MLQITAEDINKTYCHIVTRQYDIGGNVVYFNIESIDPEKVDIDNFIIRERARLYYECVNDALYQHTDRIKLIEECNPNNDINGIMLASIVYKECNGSITPVYCIDPIVSTIIKHNCMHYRDFAITFSDTNRIAYISKIPFGNVIKTVAYDDALTAEEFINLVLRTIDVDAIKYYDTNRLQNVYDTHGFIKEASNAKPV